jgi:hypothetical protein
MPEPRRFHVDYSPEDVALVRAATLSIFRILGALAEELAIVGGFVPYLLIDQEGLQEDEAHPGTQDLDLVLQLTLLDEERYKVVSKCLRESGFHAVEKAPGKHRLQQWVYSQDEEPPRSQGFLHRMGLRPRGLPRHQGLRPHRPGQAQGRLRPLLRPPPLPR